MLKGHMSGSERIVRGGSLWDALRGGGAGPQRVGRSGYRPPGRSHESGPAAVPEVPAGRWPGATSSGGASRGGFVAPRGAAFEPVVLRPDASVAEVYRAIEVGPDDMAAARTLLSSVQPVAPTDVAAPLVSALDAEGTLGDQLRLAKALYAVVHEGPATAVAAARTVHQAVVHTAWKAEEGPAVVLGIAEAERPDLEPPPTPETVRRTIVAVDLAVTLAKTPAFAGDETASPLEHLVLDHPAYWASLAEALAPRTELALSLTADERAVVTEAFGEAMDHLWLRPAEVLQNEPEASAWRSWALAMASVMPLAEADVGMELEPETGLYTANFSMRALGLVSLLATDVRDPTDTSWVDAYNGALSHYHGAMDRVAGRSGIAAWSLGMFLSELPPPHEAGWHPPTAGATDVASLLEAYRGGGAAYGERLRRLELFATTGEARFRPEALGIDTRPEILMVTEWDEVWPALRPETRAILGPWMTRAWHEFRRTTDQDPFVTEVGRRVLAAGTRSDASVPLRAMAVDGLARRLKRVPLSSDVVQRLVGARAYDDGVYNNALLDLFAPEDLSPDEIMREWLPHTDVWSALSAAERARITRYVNDETDLGVFFRHNLSATYLLSDYALLGWSAEAAHRYLESTLMYVDIIADDWASRGDLSAAIEASGFFEAAAPEDAERLRAQLTATDFAGYLLREPLFKLIEAEGWSRAGPERQQAALSRYVEAYADWPVAGTPHPHGLLAVPSRVDSPEARLADFSARWTALSKEPVYQVSLGHLHHLTPEMVWRRLEPAQQDRILWTLGEPQWALWNDGEKLIALRSATLFEGEDALSNRLDITKDAVAAAWQHSYLRDMAAAADAPGRRLDVSPDGRIWHLRSEGTADESRFELYLDRHSFGVLMGATASHIVVNPTDGVPQRPIDWARADTSLLANMSANYMRRSADFDEGELRPDAATNADLIPYGLHCDGAACLRNPAEGRFELAHLVIRAGADGDAPYDVALVPFDSQDLAPDGLPATDDRVVAAVSGTPQILRSGVVLQDQIDRFPNMRDRGWQIAVVGVKRHDDDGRPLAEPRVYFGHTPGGLPEAVRLLQAVGVEDAFVLDSGGSVSSTFDGRTTPFIATEPGEPWYRIQATQIGIRE